jgi:hypothetical protein
VKRLAYLSLLAALGCYERLEFDAPKPSNAGGAGGGAGTGGPSGASSGGGSGPCIRDEDCPLSSLRCDLQSGICFECVADLDCQARGLARCDAALHRCVECGLDQDCPSDHACDLTTRICAQRCREDEQCPTAAHGCDETRLICVECETDDDDGCALYPGRPYCIAPESRCAECLVDTNCAPGLHCDRITGKCLGCRDSRDCSGGQACEPAGHVCTPG